MVYVVTIQWNVLYTDIENMCNIRDDENIMTQNCSIVFWPVTECWIKWIENVILHFLYCDKNGQYQIYCLGSSHYLSGSGGNGNLLEA